MKNDFTQAGILQHSVETSQIRAANDPVHGQSNPCKRTMQVPTAVIYCENNFTKIDGKTANGLVRNSQAYRILSVIDSSYDGQDSGMILDGVANDIPIADGLQAAVFAQASIPDTFIYGMAPSTGKLSQADRGIVLDAIALGMDIVCGLHEFLGDDLEIATLASMRGVKLHDVRKPKHSNDLRLFDGSVAETKALRIAILGTDCAIGKRTTATILANALNAHGIKTVLIGTGQTGLMQGARFGVAMDAIPPQFCCGELEGAIVAASIAERPEVILIEGQGALSHPAFCTSAFILRGSQPHAVILQHAPKRAHRCDFPQMPMAEPSDEIALIETFSDTMVIGVTINHEGMSDTEINATITEQSQKLGLPVTDPLSRQDTELLAMVASAFPGLRERRSVAVP